MTVVLWGAFQHLISEVTRFKGENTKLKGKGKGKGEDQHILYSINLWVLNNLNLPLLEI